VRILLIGRSGQLGRELVRALAPLGEIEAADESSIDLRNSDQIVGAVRSIRPEVIVNCAAYTAVDRAEAEPELALAVNGTALGVLAGEAKRAGALLVHFSTDYVFDGSKMAPYVESDAPNPINVYGRSKLEGERAVAASGCRYLMLRTSWLVSSQGMNFLLTVVRLAQSG
jgi:dTDP-4-dehydrorhamnose reductase